MFTLDRLRRILLVDVKFPVNERCRLVESYIWQEFQRIAMAFERLLRFELDGAILYGDLVEAKEGSCLVRKLHGSIAEGFFLAHQKRLLAFQQ